MLVSMTGFGSASFFDEHLSVKVELRSLNHRYLDIVLRIPKGYGELEERCRRLASDHVFRGRLEIYVSIEEFGEGKRTVQLNRSLMSEYLKALEEAEFLLDKRLVPSVDTLFHIPDLFVVSESEHDPEVVWSRLQPVLEEALSNLVAMRQIEGERLQDEITGRLQTFETMLDKIATRAHSVVDEYRALLTRRVSELLDDQPVDEQRIAQEIALYADKANIDEELTRARSHLAQVVQTCQARGSVGRKLDFLIQELNREINTTASKVHDSLMASWVVEAKSELEKVREQVQNIE